MSSILSSSGLIGHGSLSRPIHLEGNGQPNPIPSHGPLPTGAEIQGYFASRTINVDGNTGTPRPTHEIGHPVQLQACRNVLIRSHPLERFIHPRGDIASVTSDVTLSNILASTSNTAIGFGYPEGLRGVIQFYLGSAFLIGTDGQFKRLNGVDAHSRLAYAMAAYVVRTDHDLIKYDPECLSGGQLSGKNLDDLIEWIRTLKEFDPQSACAMTLTLNVQWAQFAIPKPPVSVGNDFRSLQKLITDNTKPQLLISVIYSPTEVDSPLGHKGFHFVGVKTTVNAGSPTDGGVLINCKINNVTRLQIAKIDEHVCLTDGACSLPAPQQRPTPSPTQVPTRVTTSTKVPAPIRVAPRPQPTIPQKPAPAKQQPVVVARTAPTTADPLLELIPQPDQTLMASNVWMHTETAHVLAQQLAEWLSGKTILRPVQLADVGSGAVPITLCRILAELATAKDPSFSRLLFHLAILDSDQQAINRFCDLATTPAPGKDKWGKKSADIPSSPFPKSIVEKRMLRGNTWSPTDVGRLRPEFLPQPVDVLFTGMLLHQGKPEQVYTLAQNVHSILTDGGLWLIHDLFMPDTEPYLTIASEVTREYSGFSFPFKRVFRHAVEDNQARNAFLRALSSYKGASPSPNDLREQVTSQVFPYTMPMVTHLLQQAGFDTTVIPYAPLFGEHALAPWIGAIVARKKKPTY
ncbi:MAG: hypothetical protein ACD_62C00545G0002 [uncultured bacterium]|nr:MAG: hypothetical protein ACD_62C00545G0002 [uncultured bacterium]HLD46041.1 hypothetical protein [bacterium]